MDSKTFQLTVVPLYRRLYIVARAIASNDDDAADIVQDTMVKLWNVRHDLSRVNSIESYAFTIVRRCAIDHLRRRHDDCDVEQAVALAFEPPCDDAAVVRLAIAALPDSQRRVVEMNVYEERSTDEIARLTGFTPGNVRQLLSRGRRRIREFFAKQ